MPTEKTSSEPGSRFRNALNTEKLLQIVGAINAHTARLAEATGFRALLSSGGVAANSLDLPRSMASRHSGGPHRGSGGRQTLWPSGWERSRSHGADD